MNQRLFKHLRPSHHLMLAILLGTAVIVGIVYSYADRPDIANDIAARINAAINQQNVRGPR
jgi:hypothetical protein